MPEFKKIKIGITLAACLIATVHLIWPNLSIDNITLTLFIVAIIPWLTPMIKSFELPGGGKIEMKDWEKAIDKANEVGLLSNESELSNLSQFSFQMVANEDSNLALAGLRIEIERRLKDIAKSREIDTHNKSLGLILEVLTKQNVLTNEERVVLKELSGLLNKAVHGAEVDNEVAHWAIEIGPKILKGLDEKINK